MLIEATDFYAENISIINLYGAFSNRHTGGLGKNGQAEALINREDRFALNNCLLSPTRIHGGPVIGTIQPLIVHTFITHGLKAIQIISGKWRCTYRKQYIL